MIVLNEVKIKYEHLDLILKEKLQDIRFANSINVIVDLKEIFRKVFRPNMLSEEDISARTIEELTSDVINIISHYRNYFYKSGKYSSFYFIYSKSECELMKKKYDGYKKDYYQGHFYDPEKTKRINMVNKSVQILEKLIDQIPNCTYIDSSKFDEYLVAKFIISKAAQNELNFILSTDEIMGQLLSKNTFMINIKGIKSELVNSQNAVSVLFKHNANFSSKLISIVSCMTGTEKYSLENINKIGPYRAIKIIDELIKNNKLIDSEYVGFPLKLDKLDPKIKSEKLLIDNFELIKRNFDIITSDDIFYSKQSELTILFNKPKQTHAQNYFLELNSKVFMNYPLALDMLLKGEL
jgi:hypothetical protein